MYCLKRTFILAVSLCCAAVLLQSDAVYGKTQKHASAQKKEEKKKRRRSLLSTLLLLDIAAAGSSVKLREEALTIPMTEKKRDYFPSFLRSPEMKEKAVSKMYKQHGFNDAVEKKLERFSLHKQSFQNRLIRSGRYIRLMSDIFSQEGLPPELAFLPLIESEFNPYAYSGSKAAGPWQFMPETARKLHLKINWWVDERRDPDKSTRAAATYLKYLHSRFGSWNLALAAYNAGEGRIGSALKRADGKDFWTLRSSGLLPRETRDYIPSYIAATVIAMNPENFGFRNIEYHEPVSYDEVVIHTPMDLEVAAGFAGVPVSDIRELNPELRRMGTPPDVSFYMLKLPRGSKRQFLKNRGITEGKEPDYMRLYTVKRGDTVEKIARKIGTSVQRIIDMNSLGTVSLLLAGKKILLPIERNWNRLILHGSL